MDRGLRGKIFLGLPSSDGSNGLAGCWWVADLIGRKGFDWLARLFELGLGV